MAKLESLGEVGIYVRDRKKAREFYVRKIGLKVRDEDRKWGYIALGATKGGKDASLNLWQPTPEMWGPEYDAAVKQIGAVSGVGFRTSSLAKTSEVLKRRGVHVEIEGEEGERFGRFSDPEGNVLFLSEPDKVKLRRAGLAALEFVTVVSRDAKRAGEFFTKALGMRARRVRGEEGFVSYRLSPEGTAITPFTPSREMYKNPADYDADMAHVGEATSIMFSARDILAVQETLMSKGVRFKTKAEQAPWGGMRAEFLDVDDNVYTIIES